MPNKSSCVRKDSLSAITGPLRSLWVRGKVCGLHDSESIRQNKAKFADEAKKLLIIIAGKDKNYRLRKQRVWTDREYQEEVILSFFAGNEKAIKKVMKLVNDYRLTRGRVAKANQKPRRLSHRILSSKKRGQK